MSVALAVQFEVLPFQQDRKVLRLLQFGQEDPLTRRVQDTGRHIDNVAGMHLDSVEQATHRVDVLAREQRLELIQGHVLLQGEINLTPIDYEPRLRLTVRSA